MLVLVVLVLVVFVGVCVDDVGVGSVDVGVVGVGDICVGGIGVGIGVGGGGGVGVVGVSVLVLVVSLLVGGIRVGVGGTGVEVIVLVGGLSVTLATSQSIHSILFIWQEPKMTVVLLFPTLFANYCFAVFGLVFSAKTKLFCICHYQQRLMKFIRRPPYLRVATIFPFFFCFAKTLF